MNSPVEYQPNNHSLESRVARLEATCEFILQELRQIQEDFRDIRRTAQIDFRILFGALIFATLGLSGLMAKGFGWI